MGSGLQKLAAAAALFPKLVSLHDFALAAAAAVFPKLVFVPDFTLGRLVIFWPAFDADVVIK